MTKKFIIISAMAVTSLLLVACGSKESESEVSVMENETAITEESVTAESTIETPEIETMAEESTIEASETESESMTEDLTYTITELDKKMYVSQECDSFQEPYDTSVIFVELSKGDLIHLTGEIVFQENLEDAIWYQFQADNGETGYVSGECLSTENPNAEQKQQVAQQEQSQSQTTETTQQTQPEQTTPSQSEVAQQPSSEPEDNSPGINPRTGQEWQPGDVTSDDGQTVFGVDLNKIDDSGYR